ncbi:MAG: HlyD family efflux transporter periplasmic adaptor subunit [Pseudonocardia sp.]
MAEQQAADIATNTNGSSNGVLTIDDLGAFAKPTNTAATNTAATNTAATAKKRRRPKRRTFVLAGVAVLLVAAAGGAAYFVHANKFVTTDNANVDGSQIQINAPASGTLIDWRANQGDRVRKGEPVGRIKLQGSGAQPQKIIRAPADGTIAVNPTTEGQWVTAGTNLAIAYDGTGVYATARVDEIDVQDVHVGALVDIDVDAYSGTPVTGVVQRVQDSAAAEFSPFPESNSSGNFQKVTQVIPVRIAFTDTGGLPLVPGMNITVHIHKQP